MSKAEELSQNRYPTLAEKYAFIDGYEQAEKDLELTWEDIDWIVGEAVYRVSEDSEAEQICKEVLKLFKDYKERKQQ